MLNIKLEKATKEDAEKLASISKKAFNSDIHVGAPGPGGPPGYDSPSFQLRCMKYMDYYTILLETRIVGGIFVTSQGKTHRILERIFVDPHHHKKGIGSRAMAMLLEKYPKIQSWSLGTPEWNVRTRKFYEKLGFNQIGWEMDPNVTLWRGIWYEKVIDPAHPYILHKIGNLKEGMKDVVVEGTILSISEPRKVKSRTTGKPLTVANADLGDTSGKVVLILWNEQISQVKSDDKVRIEFGSVNSYQGVLQLNIDWGRLIIML